MDRYNRPGSGGDMALDFGGVDSEGFGINVSKDRPCTYRSHHCGCRNKSEIRHNSFVSGAQERVAGEIKCGSPRTYRNRMTGPCACGKSRFKFFSNTSGPEIAAF